MARHRSSTACSSSHSTGDSIASSSFFPLGLSKGAGCEGGLLVLLVLLLLGQIGWSRVRSGVGKRRLLSYLVRGGGLTHFPRQVGGTGKEREIRREFFTYPSAITLIGDPTVQIAQTV